MFTRRRPSKYGAKKMRSALTCRLYDSGAERDRAEELRLLERAGEIKNLQEQPAVKLTPNITYKPDFFYIDQSGVRIYEDVKGVETEGFSLKRRLWELGFGPGLLRILKRRDRRSGFAIKREVRPGRYRLFDATGLETIGRGE